MPYGRVEYDWNPVGNISKILDSRKKHTLL